MTFQLLSNFPSLAAIFGNSSKSAAASLYYSLVEQSRREAFFLDASVPDTLEGRFEVIGLHMFLVLRRLQSKQAKAVRFGQYLFDAMFDDMDHNFREMGVGDMRVGKKVRGLAEHFYGRIGAYKDAMENDDKATFAMALSRNIYNQDDTPSAGALALTDYVWRADIALAQNPIEPLLAGMVAFVPYAAARDEGIDDDG